MLSIVSKEYQKQSLYFFSLVIVSNIALQQGCSRFVGVNTSPITQKYMKDGDPGVVRTHKVYFDEFVTENGNRPFKDFKGYDSRGGI